MRRFALLLAFVSLAAAIQDPAPISGKWQVEMSIAGNESTQSCTFSQTGTELSGTCESATGSVKITGKVEGRKAAWSYKSEYNGNPLTVACDGTIESAGKIAGTVSVPEYGVEGTFTAALLK
jgi:hypothetical protein